MKSAIAITIIFIAAMIWDLSTWTADHNTRMDSMSQTIASYDNSIRLATSRLAVITWQLEELENNQ